MIKTNKMNSLIAVIILIMLANTSNAAPQDLILNKVVNKHSDNFVADIRVICSHSFISILISTNKPFNGIIYPKGPISSNSCISEYFSATNLTYNLPLKNCNTKLEELDDGLEYENTIVVQPHHRLLTSQGKGYNLKCKYPTRERTITNTQFNVSSSVSIQNSLSHATPLLALAPMPRCTMKIFRGSRDLPRQQTLPLLLQNHNTSLIQKSQADSQQPAASGHDISVKVGDKLLMMVEIDKQDVFGMHVTNCIVRDGHNLVEQTLINDKGCAEDKSIMPQFEYNSNLTQASVTFSAHKFPHTSSIYYQCNVRLCIRDENCHTDPNNCINSSQLDSNSSNVEFKSARSKRSTTNDLEISSQTNKRLVTGQVMFVVD